VTLTLLLGLLYSTCSFENSPKTKCLVSHSLAIRIGILGYHES